MLLNIVFEVLIALLLGVRKLDLLIIAFVKVITNPWIIYLLQLFFAIIIIIGIEGIIYKKYLGYKKINGILLSLILNVSAYIIGYLIFGY